LPQLPKTAWGQSTRIEQNYNRSLQSLRRQIDENLQGATTTAEISRRLQVIQNSPQFIGFAENVAANMARQVYRESGVQWRRQAARASTAKGRVIFESLRNELNSTPIGGAIQDIVINNANLIKTIPNRLDAQMASIMARNSAFAGMRHEQLAESVLERFGGLLEHEARRIARTETAKAQFALTQTRAQNLGINWYVWRTAQDGMRVREAHRHMEGVLVAWGNPPNPESLIGEENSHGPYHAGNIWNCRCYAEPLIDINWIDWPHKVYIGGAIRMMNRDDFAQIEGLQDGGIGGIIGLSGSGGVMNVLPNAIRAAIPIAKFTQYALNPDRDKNKAVAFERALGYNLRNADELVDNIHRNKQNFSATFKGNNGFGDVYECIMNLAGPNGKSANVLTSWIIEDGTDAPRLTNAYVTQKKPR